MKNGKKIITAAVALILVFTLAACGGSSYTITIINDFGYDIYELYITADTSDDWGDSLIGGRIRDGAETDIKLKDTKGVKSFDLFFVDEDDDEYEFYGLVLADKDEIEIIWDDDIYLLITPKKGRSVRVDVYEKTSETSSSSRPSGNSVPVNLGGGDIVMDLRNNLNFRMDKMCVAPQGEAWSENLLAARALETQASAKLDLSGYGGNDNFDIWLVDMGGNNYGFYGLPLDGAVSGELIWTGESPELRVDYSDGSNKVFLGKYTPATPPVSASLSKLPPVSVDKVKAPTVRTSAGGAVKHSDPGDSGYYYGLYGYYDPWGNYYYYSYDDNGYYDSYGNYCYYGSDPGDLGYCYGEFGYFDPWGNYYLYDGGGSDYYSYYYDYYSDYYWYDDSYYDDGFYYYHDGYYDYYDDWDDYYYDYYYDYYDYWDYDDYYDWDWDDWGDYDYWDYDPWSDYGDYDYWDDDWDDDYWDWD